MASWLALGDVIHTTVPSLMIILSNDTYDFLLFLFISSAILDYFLPQYLFLKEVYELYGVCD